MKTNNNLLPGNKAFKVMMQYILEFGILISNMHLSSNIRIYVTDSFSQLKNLNIVSFIYSFYLRFFIKLRI